MQYNGKYVDPYRLLGLQKDCSIAELKKNYRAMAKKYNNDDPTQITPFYQTALRLLNEAHSIVLGDIKKREEIKKEEMEKATDLSNMDFETAKKAIIMKINKYVSNLEVAKVTCDLNLDVSFLKNLSEMFQDAIAGANNCLALINLSETKENVLRLKGSFEKKQKFFDDRFYDEVPKLLVSSLMFIYYSHEAQYILKSILQRDKNLSALDWFMANQDELVTVVRYDNGIIVRLDEMLAEFSDDEFHPFVKEKIDEANLDVVNRINECLKESNSSYHHFDDDEFYDCHREIIQKIFDEYRNKIERRRNKIRYFKFALNIDEELEAKLESLIHDDEKFPDIIESLESGVFNKYLANASEYKSGSK